MHHVATKVNSRPVVVQGNMGAVASIARIFDTRIVFFLLDFQKFPIERFRILRRMAFVINSGVQDEVDGICIAAQVNAPVNSWPNRIIQRLATTIVDTAHQRHRQSHARHVEILEFGIAHRILRRTGITISRDRSSVFAIVIKQGLSLGIHEILAKSRITLRIGKELTALPRRYPVQFEQHRRIFQKPQVAHVFGADHRRGSKRLDRGESQHQRNKG